MDLLAVLPVIDLELGQKAIASTLMDNSASGLTADDLLIIDNTRAGNASDALPSGLRVHRNEDGHNLGVARSWNVGAREVIACELDYLLILSASLQFGPAIHTTWRRQMEAHWGAPLIEATGHSWHCIAIHRDTLLEVGLFDENFYPGYFEAIDWCYRLYLAQGIGGPEGGLGWPREWVNAVSVGTGLALPFCSAPAPPLLWYYEQKWGGPKGQERHTMPWGTQPLGWWEDRSIPELARNYELEVWW